MVVPREADARELGAGRIERLSEGIEVLVVRGAVVVADRFWRAEVIRVEIQGLLSAVFADYFRDLAIASVEAEALVQRRPRAVEFALVQIRDEVACSAVAVCARYALFIR